MCPSSAEPTKNHCISSNCTPRRSSPTRKARGSNPPGRTISLWQKRCRRLFLCCIVENWQFHHTILGRGFTVLSNHFRAVSPTWCPLSLPLSGIWQEKGQFFWEKQNKSCCFQNVSISPQPISHWLRGFSVFCSCRQNGNCPHFHSVPHYANVWRVLKSDIFYVKTANFWYTCGGVIQYA